MILLKEGSILVRKNARITNPKLKPLIKLELEKMEKVEIIFSIKHLEWISKLVIVRNNNGEIHICVDFQDLNQASLKDNYPLQNMESFYNKLPYQSLCPCLTDFQVIIKS